jgi:Putative zinc-finger
LKDSESNSLRRELAAFTPTGDHPDPDIITAFAENSLVERERLAVMAHLADCAECRAVLSFVTGDEAAPATPAFNAVPIRHVTHVSHRSWLAWPAAAALIAIVCIVALRHERNRTEQLRSVTQKPQSLAKAPQEVAQLRASGAPPQTPQKRSATSAHPAPKQAVPPAVAEAKIEQQKQTQLQTKIQTPQQPAADQASYGALSIQPMRESNAQSADLRLPVPHVPSPRFSNAAAANAVGGPQAMSPSRPRWSINEQGQPERAFGDGPWQPILGLAGSKMRVVSIMNGEVWVGGDNSRVYRSSDEGATWQEIPLPAKNGSAHTIVHIRFETAQTGTIDAADGTTWQTADGGNTWK